MWNEDEILQYLKDNLKESRFRHTLGVVKAAIELSNIYNCNIEKAKLAALLHDVAKYKSNEEIIEILNKENFLIDTVIKGNLQIMHGFCGAYIARETMGVKDKEILDAICYHTTGKENMTLLGKIIYLADFIEENRSYDGVEELRKLCKIDLDKALLKAFDNTIIYVVKNNWTLHLDTIKARNYLINII